MEGILGKKQGAVSARQRRYKSEGRGKRKPKMAGVKARATLKNEEELLARRKLFNRGVRANSDEELAFAAE
jgi:hypothetical protein